MNAVIFTCTSLILHVNAAQEKEGTHYPVMGLDQKNHIDPVKMNDLIRETMETLPPEVDTILVSMGLCGGSWSGIELKQRVVIPRVDDCITLLLHTDDKPAFNLKQHGHFYFRDSIDGIFSIEGLRNRLCEKDGEIEGEAILQSWFSSYTDADIIDTGIYDCHSEKYMKKAKENANLVSCRLNHVPGSNIILEKLVSGRWDSQFIIAEKGCIPGYTAFIGNGNNS